MKKLQNKIKYLSLLPILMTMILMSCSDKDTEDIIYNYDGSLITIKGITYSIEKDHAIVKGPYRNETEDVVILPEIKVKGKKYPVTVIYRMAFNQSPVKKLTIPASIEKIEEDAFKGVWLEELYIEDLKSWCNIDFEITVEWDSHQPHIFYNSNPMRKNTTVYVEGEALGSDLVIPPSVEIIKSYAFQYLDIKSVHLSSRQIEVYAFYGCGELNEVFIEEEVESMHLTAFTWTDNLKFYIKSLSQWIDIDNKGDIFPLYDLYVGGKKIEDVAIPENIRYIKPSCFAGCNIKSVTFHSQLDSIGNYAFARTSLKNVVIPGNVKSIGNHAFARTPLKEVNLNEGLLKLGGYAFADTGIEELTLPASLKEFGYTDYRTPNTHDPNYNYQDTFYENLTINVLSKEVPEVSPHDYYGDLPFLEEGLLCVPEESLEKYKANWYWGIFKNIVGKKF